MTSLTADDAYQWRYRAVASALHEALREDPFYRTMEQTVDVVSPSEGMIRYMDYSMLEAERYGVLEHVTAPAAGAAIWATPVSEAVAETKSREKHDFLERCLGPRSLDTYHHIGEFMSAQTTARIPDDAWYLSILGVTPDHQSRGLGRRLLADTISAADRAMVATYLETFTPRNIRFYRRLGYDVLFDVQEPVTQASYAVMIRPPGGLADNHHN